MAMAAAKASITLAMLTAVAADEFSQPLGCHTMLSNIAAQGHSDLQLAAYCHAGLPPQLCRDATKDLGKQPWSEDHIAATCGAWEGQYGMRTPAGGAPGRSAQDMSFPDLQKTIDQCIAAKSQAGLCKDQHTGTPMTIEECIAWKQKTYPVKTQEIMSALKQFYAMAMGEAPPPSQKSEQVGPIDASRGPGLGLVVGSAFAAASVVAGSVVAYRRVRRTSGPRQLLAQEDQELAAQSES